MQNAHQKNVPKGVNVCLKKEKDFYNVNINIKSKSLRKGELIVSTDNFVLFIASKVPWLKKDFHVNLRKGYKRNKKGGILKEESILRYEDDEYVLKIILYPMFYIPKDKSKK